MSDATRLQQCLSQIDDLNQQDPTSNNETNEDKTTPNLAPNSAPKEVLYSQRMQYRLKQFLPDASENLQIAAYCQHVQRWTITRSDYPMNRSGYKKWRTELGKFHADTTAQVMHSLNYDEASIERVKYLLQKKGLKRDPETQALEDVICLVFLEYYLEDFTNKHEEGKIISIIQKTWNKMSEQGRSAALKLPLPQHLFTLVEKALEG